MSEYRNKTEKEMDSVFTTIFKFKINLNNFYGKFKRNKNRTSNEGTDNPT